MQIKPPGGPIGVHVISTLAFGDLLRWGVGSQRAWPPWLNPCDFCDFWLFHYTTAWEDTYQANGKMFVYLSDSSNASMFPLEYNSHQHKIVTKTLNCYNFKQLIGWSVLGQNAVLTEISKCIPPGLVSSTSTSATNSWAFQVTWHSELLCHAALATASLTSLAAGCAFMRKKMKKWKQTRQCPQKRLWRRNVILYMVLLVFLLCYLLFVGFKWA